MQWEIKSAICPSEFEAEASRSRTDLLNRSSVFRRIVNASLSFIKFSNILRKFDRHTADSLSTEGGLSALHI